MATNIGPKIGIEGEAEYRKQINQIIQETKTLKSAYEAVSSSVDKDTASVKQNKEMKKILTQEIEAQTKKVKELEDMVAKSAEKYGDADPKTLKWKESLNKANTELNEMNKELKDMPSTVQLLGDKMQAASDKVKGFGDKVKGIGDKLAPLSAAAAGVLTGSAKAAIDFESAFTGVQKTVDATDTEFQELSDWIKEASTRMASSKTDIAGVMETAGQLGISGVSNLEAFTETMIMLGDTTNLSADDAASSLAKFMNITGDPTGSVSNLGSAIVDLGNHFATTEADIVEMSTRMASAGTIAGLSSTDILALATSMSSVGINAEAGGTAMSQTLQKISKAVDLGSDSLETYAQVAGMSAEEFSNTWKSSPIEAVEAFIGGLGRLNEEDESVISTLDELGLSGIRQSNMLQALALSSDMLTDAVDTANGAYDENIALSDEAEKRYGTTASQLEQTKEKISNVAIEIGERLLPYVDKAIDFMDKVKSAWDGLSPDTQDMIVKGIAIAAALAPVLSIAGSLIGVIGSLMSPVGLAVAAIGGLVVAGVALYENWDTIKEKAGELKDKMSTAWSNMKDDMKRDWDEMKQNASEKWENIKTTISDKVAENGGGIGGVLKTAAEGYAKAWELNFSAMDKLTGGKLSDIKKTVSDKVEGIWKSIKGVGEKISGFHISLPDIKMPHFRISGNFSLKPLSVPSISVDWYAKAMNNGIRLTQPTIFGAAGDRLLGGGEVGNEWVIGENSLMSMIRAAVGSASGRGGNVTVGDTTIVINAADGQDVEEIANRVDEIITGRLEALEAAWA